MIGEHLQIMALGVFVGCVDDLALSLVLHRVQVFIWGDEFAGICREDQTLNHPLIKFLIAHHAKFDEWADVGPEFFKVFWIPWSGHGMTI